MRFLFCPLGGAGFVASAVAVARGLVARAHEVSFLASPRLAPMLADASLALCEGSERCAAAFEVRSWGTPEAIVAQAWHTRRAAKRWRPDVIVTSQLALGPLLAREELGIPVAVIGLAAYLWPHAGAVPEAIACGRQVRSWYGADSLRIFEGARASVGLAPLAGVRFERFPLLGDRHLLQSVPALEPDAATLPPSVVCVGALRWDPARDAALASWLERGRDGARLVYAQPGRSFGQRSFFPGLVDAAARHGLRIAAAMERADFAVDTLPADAWCRPQVPADQVLPHAVAAVAEGHTTVVLAALGHGVPLVLVPNGSGTDVIADHCERAGAAVVVRGDERSTDGLAAALARVTEERRYADAARRLQAAFDACDGVELACRALVALGRSDVALPASDELRGRA